MKDARWGKNTIVALIEWIPQLTSKTLPQVLRERLTLSSFSPPPVGSDPHVLAKLAETEPKALEMLLQWSDLIIFDYLTGHYDRALTIVYRAVKNKQLFDKLLRETTHKPIRNLAFRS